MRRCGGIGIATASVALALSAGLPATAGAPDQSRRICNDYLPGLDPRDGLRSAPPVDGGCYPTPAAAIAAARRAEAAEYGALAKGHHHRKYGVIGFDCDAGGYLCAAGNQLWHWGTHGQCDRNTYYARPRMEKGWNNRVILARAGGYPDQGRPLFRKCNRFIHHTRRRYRGPWLNCGHHINPDSTIPNSYCESMPPPFKQNTSSEVWLHCRNPDKYCYRGR